MFIQDVFLTKQLLTDRYMNSFFPRAITSWNILISHFDDFPPVDSLKQHILSLIRPKNKSFFGIHDPIGLRYLFQLRLSLSPLRIHKSHHNFVDTPCDLCDCNQGIEDTRHFLLSFYVTQRVDLLTRVNEILQKYKLDHLGNQFKLYVYGHDSINYVDNRDISRRGAVVKGGDISTNWYVNI